MKHLLLVLFFATSMLAITNAQTVYHKKSTSVAAAAKPTGPDSALIYYNLGWDNYKLDSMGPARYYWEKASYASGKQVYKYAAMYRLGLMQQNGEGVDTNLNSALDYYKKASGYAGKPGNPDAIKAIGGFYENGYGVDQSYTKALEWYNKAKLAGNAYVDEDLTRIKERIKESKAAALKPKN